MRIRAENKEEQEGAKRKGRKEEETQRTADAPDKGNGTAGTRTRAEQSSHPHKGHAPG